MHASLAWPFFDEEHRAFAAALERWLAQAEVFDDENDPDASCRAWVRALAEGGWLCACVPGLYGGVRADVDARTLCLARERLAQRSALADFAFAMQGLGAGPLVLFGSAELARRYLPK
ncbi:MAG: acyl-CoA dehydrogenase family protein, partial [Candidatus Baltobacteraceae bacterium]